MGFKTIKNLVVHKHHGIEDMLASMIACFDEDYLDSLPKPEGKASFFWPAVSQARNWRWLARYQISLILGWAELREKGDSDGFETAFNAFPGLTGQICR
jgi:hypothetical protein